MHFRIPAIACVIWLTATQSIGGPSGQHMAKAADYSGKASAHGSAAAGSAVAVVTAVPITVVGGVVALSGAALFEVGEGTLELGDALSRAGTGQPIEPALTPNGVPTLR